MMKHKRGKKGAAWRDTSVRAQEGEEHVQAQGYPRVGCGSLDRSEEADHVPGLGEV